MTATQIASATADTNTTHKGDTRMNREETHQRDVRLLTSRIDDDEMRPEMIDISHIYATVRLHLIAAINGLRDIDGYSLDESGYHELTMELRSMLDALRSDEIALLELCSNMNEPTETAQSSTVQDGSNLFANANDVIVSGMSDTALLSALDGKAH